MYSKNSSSFFLSDMPFEKFWKGLNGRMLQASQNMGTNMVLTLINFEKYLRRIKLHFTRENFKEMQRM